MFDSKKELFMISSDISGHDVATMISASRDESSLISSKPMTLVGPINKIRRYFKLFLELRYLRPRKYQLQEDES